MTELICLDARSAPLTPKAIQQALLQSGAIIIRNPKQSLEDFLTLTEAMGSNFVTQGTEAHQYRNVGGTNTRQFLNPERNLFSITGYQLRHPTPLHGELYFQEKDPPHLLWFYCEKPSQYQGYTNVCDGVKLFEALSKSDQDIFLKRCLTYQRYHKQELWESLYKTQDKSELETYLKSKGFEFEWHSDDALTTRFTRPAVHIWGDKTVFVNNFIPFASRQLFAPDTTRARISFSDGYPIEEDLLLRVKACGEKLTRPIPLEKGDIAIVDNIRMMHGRPELSEHEDRRICLRMSNADFLNSFQEPYDQAMQSHQVA